MVTRPLDHHTSRAQSVVADLQPLGLRDAEVGGWAYLIACPWVPTSSPLTHKVYLLPFLSYLADSKSISARPSDPDMMTSTALEAIASSSGKNCTKCLKHDSS